MRLHELAKELGITPKDLIPQIRKLGYDAKSHMSQVEDEVVELMRKICGVKGDKSATGKRKKSAEGGEAGAAENVESGEDAADSSEEAELEELEQELAELEAAEKEAKGIPVAIPITVGNLAEKIDKSIPEMIKALMGIGVFANVNQLLNEEIVFKVAEALEVKICKEESEVDALMKKSEKEDAAEELQYRPPIVTMMGHVDHGKTSLLDAIRETNVAGGEKGAITQHISAYSVEIKDKGHVTFVDTPGHEAFTAMRARGANVTDVVVLVVAADDGVMPQTIEAADHAREAGCPIVVAVNKCDLPSANINNVMTGLQRIDLAPEDWGGKTVCVEVSAKTGAGLDELMELLLLESEILDLKANPDRKATGTVIESHLSKGSGPIATVIVQKGTLRVGDAMLCGKAYGRVRALKNNMSKNFKEATPSIAVEVSGLNEVVDAGDTFIVVEDEKTARQMAEKKQIELREIAMRGDQKHLSLEELYEKISEGNFKELKIIIKADVQGSIDALTQALEGLSTEKCGVRVVHGGIGGINESDVVLAAASDAIVIGFHVKADNKAYVKQQEEKVDIRYYNIIYEAVDDVRNAMEGLLEPTYKEVMNGRAELRKIFKSSKVGTIGGGYVIKGKITRQHSARVLRDNIVVHEGGLKALKRFKDDVKEVDEGYECGISFEGFNQLQEGDVVESFRMEKIASKL